MRAGSQSPPQRATGLELRQVHDQGRRSTSGRLPSQAVGQLQFWEPTSYFDDVLKFTSALGGFGFDVMAPETEGRSREFMP